ncbi:MAG: phosphoglucosamine mutase [Armatimonadetes bacterium]|nr:phosphoglucosamine mutase [Armatimonadota bacterium]
MSPQLAFDLGRAAGAVIVEQNLVRRVVIGRDTRRSGPMLGASLAAGFCHAGIDVVALGVIPTGGLSYFTRTGGFSMGAVISASHNPAPDNGVKFIAHNGRKISEETESRISSLVGVVLSQVPVGAGVGFLDSGQPDLSGYLSYLVSLVPERLDGMKVAIDGSQGAGFDLGVRIFRELGAEVTVVGCAPDGLNINFECGATYPAHIQALTKQVGADLGVAYDGDADRAVFSDNLGRLINGDRTMAIWCRHWRESLNPKAVVGTVMSNGGFALAMATDGIELHRANVGDKYVGAQLRKISGQIGGEQSGHIIFSERGPTGDGLITALEMARVLKREGKPADKLFGIYDAMPQIMVNVEVADREAFKSSTAVSEAISSAEARVVGRGRVSVRASGTQPMVRVMVEADDYELRDFAAQEIVDALEKNVGVTKIRRIELTNALGD